MDSSHRRTLAGKLTAALVAASLASPSALALQRPSPAPPEATGARTATTRSAPSAGVSADWSLAAQAEIGRSEYRVSWQEKTALPGVKAAYQAPNRAQNLRTYFTATGVRLVPRTTEASSWWVGLRLASLGDGRRQMPVGAAKPAAAGNRVEYRRRGIVEWYVNDERGVEQGFTLSRRPATARTGGSLRLDLAVAGNTVPRRASDGRAVEFLEPRGAVAVRYADLEAVDADGRQLPSRMDLRGCTGAGACTLALVVEDAGARYPVTIDPLASSPSWAAESDQASARFGAAVATAGDVNGDGYDDVLVTAPQFDNGQVDEGRVYVFHGSPSGLSLTPNWTAESDQAGAVLGWRGRSAGDVNGDGYDDVIVGAEFYDNGQTDEGRAFVYYGSASGLALTPNWTAESDQASAFFGYSVGTAGDVNNDGYDDVIVGAYGYDNGQSAEGRAYVFFGSASGLAPTPGWTAESDQTNAYFSVAVGTAGDVNGDGYDDVIVGAQYFDNGQADEGRVYVYHGSSLGLSATPNWTAESDQASSQYGYAAATAGDVNGDGYADVVVGAYWYDNGESNEGRAYLYLGAASGLSPTPNWMAESDQASAQFATAVGTTGDVNGDGYDDVIVGAIYYDNGQTDEGRAYVYYGSASGPSLTPNWTAESDQIGAYFGFSVGTAGNVNGDGAADAIVGAYFYDNPQADEGRAFVFHGSDLIFADGFEP